MTQNELDALCEMLWTVHPAEVGRDNYSRLEHLATRAMLELEWQGYETWRDYHLAENIGG